MPELLEVEAYRSLLERRALHRPVAGVDAPDGWYLKGGLTAPSLVDALRGRRFVEAGRHGKLLLARVDSGSFLGLRFGMTGRLVVDGAEAIDRLEYGSDRALDAWNRLVVHFADGGELLLRDARRLGGVALDPDTTALGPDAAALDPADLARTLDGRRAPVKGVLMDQSRVAGLGNLLTDEILWRAGLDPTRPGGTLAGDEVARLCSAISDTLADLGGRGGSHTGDLQPQRRRDGRCPRCELPLLRRRVAGRTTYSCRACQPDAAS